MTGTVTLSGSAPSGDAIVTLTSNNSLAPAPAFVTVPAGSTSAVFSFNTLIPSAEAVMTLIASYNGGSAVALLTLEPAPALAVTPASLDFGSQLVGTSSTAMTLTVSNAGTALLTLNFETIVSGLAFHATANTCGATLAVGANCAISVVFTPTTGGPAADILQIGFANPQIVQSITLSGTGTTPQVSLSPTTINFGNQQILSTTSSSVTLTNIGTATLSVTPASLPFAARIVGSTSLAKIVTIKNNLSTTLTISGIALAGTNPGDFANSGTTCKTTLAAGATCTASVTFTPTAKGARVAILAISDSASSSPQTVSLSGTGK